MYFVLSRYVINVKRPWFYNRLFYKDLHNLFFFYFASLFAAQFSLFEIRMTQKISKGETGCGKKLGMTNYDIYFKNNFNRVVMNITQNLI